MAKFYGNVGFLETVEEKPGKNVEQIIERPYYGDEKSFGSKWSAGGYFNDNKTAVVNQLSIVADAFAYEHFSTIKYVEWMGVKWKVNTIDVKRPRLYLTLGEVWNEESV